MRGFGKSGCRWLAVYVLLLTVPAGVTFRPQTAMARSSPVLLDIQGRCPRVATTWSAICRRTVAGNVAAGNFQLPQVPWGIAYAYNCGRRPGEFIAVVGLINLDGSFPDTRFVRHGRTGHGVHMETGRGIVTWKATIPAYRRDDNIEINSTCTWHVRAVLGRENVVRRYVPPIPG